MLYRNGRKSMLRVTLIDVQGIEMMKPLSKLFEEARSACIEWGGEPLYGLYELTSPDGLEVEFLSSINTPVQGLALKIYGGILEIEGTEAHEMLLWCDTAPTKVPVSIKTDPGKKAKLKIWNVWRGKVGGVDVTQAWLGNAGMRIEQSAGGKELVLLCSDGEGAVEFSDLKVRVTIG